MSDRFGSIEIDQPGVPAGTDAGKRGSGGRSRPPRKPQASRSPSGRGSKNWFWLVLAVFIIAVYSGAGFFGVPYYFTKIFPNRLYRDTGMLFIAEDLQFNPYTFVLKTGPAQIVDGSGDKIVTLESFFTSLRPLSLLRRDMVCTRVRIDSPEIHVVRDGSGKYNLGKLINTDAGDYDKEIIHFSDLPFFFSLNNITVRRGKITFNDQPESRTHTVENIELELPTFSNIPVPVKTESFMRPHFSAVINGSPIELNSQTKISDSGDEHEINNLTWALNDIDLQTYVNYLPFSLPFELIRGRAKGTVDLSFDPGAEKGRKFSFDFSLQLLDTEFTANQEALSLNTPDALIQGELLPVSRTLAFSMISLDKPMLRSTGSSLLHNLDQVMASRSTKEQQELNAKPPINLAINTLTVQGGLLALFAEKKEKNPVAQWQEIRLDLQQYSSGAAESGDKSQASFQVSANLAGSPATFTWKGSLAPDGSCAGPMKIERHQAGLLFQDMDIPYLSGIKGTATIDGQLRFFPGKAKDGSLPYEIDKASLKVDNFAITESGRTFLSAASIQAGPVVKSAGEFDLGAVAVEDGVLSLLSGQLPAFFNNFTDKTAGTGIGSLSFSGSAALQTGASPQTKLTFEKFQLKAGSLNVAKPAKNLELNAESSSGGSVKMAGTVKLRPFQLGSDIQFQKLPVQTVLPLFSKAPFVQQTSGVMEGEGKLLTPDFGFKGAISTSAISLDHPDFPALTWQKSSFTEVDFTSNPLQLKIVEASIDSPELALVLSSSDGYPIAGLRSFFQEHFPPQSTTAGDSKNRRGGPPLDIKTISFANGSFSVNDRRVSPEWKASVQDFTAKIIDIYSAASAKASFFSATGTLDRVPFTLSGNLDIFGEKDNSDFTCSLSAFPLASFREQLQQNDTLNPDQTTFDLKFKSTSTNDISRKTGEIVFSGLKAVPGFKETALTLAFLTNADGETRFTFDFEDQEPGRYEALFEQILSLYNTTMIKGAVSPLLLANGEFDELIGSDFIEFSPGEIMLSENGRNVLTRYTALLIAHPGIGLVLSGGCDSEKDYAAVREQLEISEQTRVDNINEKLLAERQAEKTAYEERLAEQKKKFEQTGVIAEIDMPQSLMVDFTPVEPVPVAVDEVMLLELAERRLDIIKQFFTSQLALEPGRIKVNSSLELPEKEQQVNGVKITLIPVEP
jgi:hypothetical protein